MSESSTDTKASDRDFGREHDKPDAQRVRDAITAFVRDVDRSAALHLEACVHCGMCAGACQFYVQTGDPKYTPALKFKPFQRIYRREVGPFAPVFKLFTKGVSLGELEAWEELVYDSCTLCGRCTLVCPMGIDIPSLIELSRHAMFQAGLVPDRLYRIATHAERKQTSQSATPGEFLQIVQEIADAFQVHIPVDETEAEIVMAVSASQLEGHRDSFANTARILNHIGRSWTIHSQGFEATNFGMLSGHVDLQKRLTLRLVHSALRCKAEILLLPECGHAYGALRWKGPQWLGRELPFRVLHMSEFLGQSVSDGSLRLTPLPQAEPVTYHDPCQTARRGGVFAEPRQVLAALGIPLKEMQDAQQYNWCCGGGGGVLANERAEPLRYEVFKLKMNQVERSGAKHVVSACHQCAITFDRGKQHFHWDVPFTNLVELVAAHLAGDGDHDSKPEEAP